MEISKEQMKLIKLKNGHFVLTSDDPIPHVFPSIVVEKLTTGEYDLFQIDNPNDIDVNTQRVIIGSTNMKIVSLTKTRIIDLSEIKKLIGEVDVDIKAEEWIEKNSHRWSNNNNEVGDNYDSFKSGYIQALDDNKDKKFTEVDMLRCWNAAFLDAMNMDSEDYKPLFYSDFINSIQPKTEWDVEIEDGRLKIK